MKPSIFGMIFMIFVKYYYYPIPNTMRLSFQRLDSLMSMLSKITNLIINYKIQTQNKASFQEIKNEDKCGFTVRNVIKIWTSTFGISRKSWIESILGVRFALKKNTLKWCSILECLWTSLSTFLMLSPLWKLFTFLSLRRGCYNTTKIYFSTLFTIILIIMNYSNN